jgi:hypothetical protein
MAKGQRRSNRETKKPKQPKSETKSVLPSSLAAAPERDSLKDPSRRHPPRR